ncbi:MAG: HAD-IB family hydrolase [Cyanobacteriota bacterium]
MNNKYTIAAFDFDDTITKKCTFVDIIIYSKGLLNFLLGMSTLLPDVILYKMGFLSNYLVKKKMFTKFFAGQTIEDFKLLCNEYSTNKIDEMILTKAKNQIEWHKSKGHKLVIVTASIEDWIKPWAINNGFDDVLSTKVQIKNGILTGDFENKNCYGKEKVRRFLEKYPDRSNYYLYAYGDSDGDKDLLRYADESLYNYKKFNKK